MLSFFPLWKLLTFVLRPDEDKLQGLRCLFEAPKCRIGSRRNPQLDCALAKLQGLQELVLDLIESVANRCEEAKRSKKAQRSKVKAKKSGKEFNQLKSDLESFKREYNESYKMLEACDEGEYED